MAQILGLDDSCKKAVYELAQKTAHPTEVAKQIEQFCNSQADKPEHISRMSKMLANACQRKRLVYVLVIVLSSLSLYKNGLNF